MDLTVLVQSCRDLATIHLSIHSKFQNSKRKIKKIDPSILDQFSKDFKISLIRIQSLVIKNNKEEEEIKDKNIQIFQETW